MPKPDNSTNIDDWDEPLITDPMFTSSHVFSTSDITVTFDGLTVGSAENPLDVFDTTGANGTKTTKDGVTLYPIDSEFGYLVSDFTDATQKSLNGDYAEGWAGDLTDAEGNQIGIVVSDSPTDTFKVPANFGTWLAGLGGNTIKASTEHYVVMQNVLSDQVTPQVDLNGDGDFDDPGEAALDKDGNPALYPLDDTLYVVGGEHDGRSVLEVVTELEGLADGAGDLNGDGAIDIRDVLAPNETEITENIAVGQDYSVTVKDDGKLLYRWGNMIKKPNDIRMETTLDLPDDWSEYNVQTGLRNLYKVTEAELVVHHTITNNPNDQVRPEDFENEAAIGRLPTYEIIEDYNEDGNGAREVWVSTDDYYAGDGTLYPAGTILKDQQLADFWADSEAAKSGTLSSDQVEGFTNAWYTTMDREPFEPVLNEDGTEYADSGPRWRLKPDKYGQDLPSVVIPTDPSLQPPTTQDQEKYEVGAETQTVLNLLDWGTPAKPLSVSAGWQAKPGEVSAEGVNYTDDFDVAFYVKGDIKPATIYSTELLLNYEKITPYAFGDAIAGTEGDDYLVGIGNNTFTGGAGTDTFVLAYGASLEGVALSESTVTDFEVGTDAIGLIGLGVDDTNFDDMILQAVVDGNLEITLDRDGMGTGEDGVRIATLDGVDETLEMEADFLMSNPGPATGPGDPGDEPNLIAGTAASETLTGTPGDDIITGLAGNDMLYGLGGDDELNGGAGLDRLYGGEGADVFVFEAGNEMDIVYDFEDGTDLVDLQGILFEDLGISAYRASGTQLTFGSDQMILRDVAVADIDINDFVFDNAPVA